MEKDLITNYVDGESTNDRLNRIRQAREYNQSLKNSSGFISAVAPSEIAYAHNQAPTINYGNRSLGETVTDAWRMFYNNMQQAQIDSNDAEINSATLNMEDAKFLIDYNNAVNGTITPQEFTQQHGIRLTEAGIQAQETLNRLKQDGVYTSKGNPTEEDLLDIYNDNNELLIDAQERRNANYKQLTDSKDVHDVSQYATQKSNESAYNVGNFLYKTAAQLGSSMADWDWQTLSTIAGFAATAWASMKVGAASGATVGTLAGPGGAAVGGAAGAVAGFAAPFIAAIRSGNFLRTAAVGFAATAAAESAGGIQARQGEARMEAYARYADNMDNVLQQYGIDKNELIAKGRRYAANNQINVPVEQLNRMSDDDIYKLIINGTIPINDNNFEHARRQAYRGTLELYEKNMSLEAGDVLTDMLYYVPGLRANKIFRSIANPIEAPYHITRAAAKKMRNPFNKMLTNRNRLNSDIVREAQPEIAKALKPLTGKGIAKRIRKEDLKSYASAQFAGAMEEATEEGSQYIRSDMAGDGEYNDRQVSTSLWDAMTNGNLTEDLLEGWYTRARSTLAVFTPFDPIYSNDEELRENYIAGAILSQIDPRALVSGGRDLYNLVTNYKKDKQFADIFARSLDEQDFVDRSVDLLQSVRQLNKSGRRYADVLDHVADMMKSGKYDLGTISDQSEGPVTEQDIDDYINEEKKQFGLLMAVKNEYAPKAVQLGMTEYDQDIYTAIAYDTITSLKEQQQQSKISIDELNTAVKQAFDGDTVIANQIKQQVDNLLKLDETQQGEVDVDYLTESVKALVNINNRINHATKQSQKFGNIAEGYAFLKSRGLSTVENAEQLKSLQDSANTELANLLLIKQQILDGIARHTIMFNTIRQLEQNLEQYKQIDLTKEPNIDTDGIEAYQDWYNAVQSIDSDQKELDRLTKKMNNLLNQIEKIDISDPELNNYYSAAEIDQIELNMLAKTAKMFTDGDKRTIDLVKKYKQRVSSQAKERDAINAGENLNNSENIGNQTITAANLNDEQLKQQLDNYNNQISTILQEAAATSPAIVTFLRRITNGMDLLKDPVSKSRYLSNSLKKFTKAIENIKKGELTDTDKNTYDQLKNIIDQATSVLDEIDKRAAEKTFNAQRRKLNINVSTQEWTAEDGKKYLFLTSETEHSVDEGVILHAIDVTENEHIKELQNQIQQTRKELNKYKKDAVNNELSNEERQQAVEKAKNTQQHLKNLIQDFENNLANRRVEFKVSESREYLNSFTVTNNQNQKIRFENTLNKIIKNSDEILKDLVEKRKIEVDYTTDELLDETTGAGKSSPDWLEKQEEERLKKKDKFKAKAYAFTGTSRGVAYKNRLLNPHYAANQWYGSIEVQRWDEVKEFDFAKAESEKGSKVKWSRPKAYHTFEKLLKLCADKSDQEILDFITKIKSGKVATIPVNSFNNMVNALPIGAVLFNNRLRTSNDTLMPTRLVMPDITSKDRVSELSDYEKSLRENMIMNLIRKTKEDETAKINVAQGNVSIFYKSFAQNTKSVVNQNNPILYDETGETLTQEQLNSKYDSIIVNKNIPSTVVEYASDFQAILDYYGFSTGDVFSKTGHVSIQVGDETVDALSYLLRGIAKYGDQLITENTLITNYIVPVFGKSKASRVNRKELSERLLDQFMEKCPDMFLSYDSNGGQSLDTRAQVEYALSNNYRIQLDISKNGDKLFLNQRSVDSIIEIAEEIEGFLKSSNSRAEFLEELTTAGYKFEKNVAQTLGNYFVYRKFNRLINPSNIVNVLTSGRAVPVTNSLIDSRQNIVTQDLISNVKALGLIYDEASDQFYYSADYYKNHIETLQRSETNEESQQDDLSIAEQAIEEGYQNMRKLIQSSPKVSVLKENVLKAYAVDDATILAEYNASNEVKSARVTKKVLVWYVDYIYDKQLEDLRVQQQIEEDLDGLEERVADDFKNKRYEPVVIAYATANGTIMRYDTYDNKMVAMANATGTPGSVYLVLPSFFNSNRNRVPVKLNPQHIDINVARVIANLMYKVASGQISEDTLISNDLADGLHVYQSITVKQFIDQLMYYGTEAIERNPSNANLDKLVYIKNNSIFYGNTLDGKGNEVTEDSIEDFAQWISQNKNYRVDKDLLVGTDSIVRGGYTIVDSEGNEVLSQTDGGNYITHLIKSGMIMTDMDTSANSTIFSGNPQVYMDYTNHFKDLTPTGTEQTSTNSTQKTKNAETTARNAVPKIGTKARLANALRTFFYDLEINKTLQVKFNDKVLSLQLNDNHRLTKAGFEYLRNQIDKLSGDITFSIIVDGQTVDFNDDDPSTTKLMSTFPGGKVSLSSENEATSNASDTDTQSTTTGTAAQKENKNNKNSKDLDSFIEQLTKEYDDTGNSRKLKLDAEEYYEQHPELKQDYETAKEFAENCFKLVLGGDDRSMSIEDIISGSRPASGLTPASEKTSTNKDMINVNLNPVSEKSQTQEISSTPISDDDKKTLLSKPSYFTAKYIINTLSSNSSFQSADAQTKKEMLAKQYLALAGNMFEPMDLLQKYGVFKNNIGEWLLKYNKDNNSAVFSAVKSFFKNFVRMENYDKAIARAKKILGQDFNFETYTELPFKTSDDGTKMYIFGVCTANGIRLFRDAAKNKIKRGVAYHEAFHRVSLLLLSPSERKQMYENLYKIEPTLKNATEREKQEYLADLFANWVLKQIRNENPVYKFINKLGEYLRKLIDRLRNGVGGIQGRHHLHSLFNDMYKGKYAYLKASRENEEYFRLAFGNDPLYSSFKYNGQELANSAKQFNNIYRNLLAKLLENADVLRRDNGQIKLDFDALNTKLQEELNNDKELISLFVGKNDIEQLMPVMNHASVLQNILQPEHWNSWVKYIKLQARTLFSLEAIKNPNEIDYSELYEDQFEEKSDEELSAAHDTIQNDDSIKPQYTRNQYSALDADVRLFLYGITADNKLNSDGLYEYADVWQLWHELCHACSEITNTDEMIQTIKRYSSSHRGEISGNTFRQLYELLNSDSTTDYIKNKLFSNVVKYINEFININYIRRDDGGLDVVVENANYQKSQDSNRKRWQNALLNTVNHFKLIYPNLKDSSQKSAYLKTIADLRIANIPENQAFDKVYNVLQQLGVENVTQEDLLNFINKRYNGKIDKIFKTRFDKFVNTVNRAVLAAEDANVKKEISELFNPTTKDVKYTDNIILELSEFLTTDTVGNAKNDTVRIAKGAKAYIIGQYNHITRFFRRLIKNKDLQDRYENDYYTKMYKDGRTITYYGSKWLHYLKGLDKKARLLTLSGTVYNSQYSNSNDFMGITSIEDMLNKFSITISGNHNIPELANKKTYYVVSNIPMEGMPISLLGTNAITISDQIYNTFKGYLLSEIMAIRHAMQQRKNFVDLVNKQLNTSYTYKQLSELSQEEQERLFKQRNVAILLGSLRKEYHYTSKKNKPIYKNGKRVYRSFGIDLNNGAAYRSRHFSEFVDKLGITENTSDAQIMQWVKGNEAKNFITNMFDWNIRQVMEFLQKNQMITGYDPEVGLAKQNIQNVLLPLNQILSNQDLKGNVNTDKPNSIDLVKIISYFVVNNMCDIIEFEKLVSGDIALYGSNKDSINKRYSAQTSTTSIKNDKGWKNEFSSPELREDTLYNSDTYNVIEVNTTKIDGLKKYLTEAKRYLGVDAYNVEEDKLDYHKLIDPKTKDFTKEAKNGLLVQRYLDHEVNNRSYAIGKTHLQLAQDIVKDVENRLSKYRSIDPTDAQTWISADMNRRLKQSEGLWTSYDEACHNLLEFYDKIDTMRQVNQKAFRKLLIKLNIDEKELFDKFNAYKANKLSEEEYADYILGKTRNFIQGSLKYVFFGNAIKDETLSTRDNSDTVYKLYDKTSLSPLYKIFCKGHVMEEIYDLMEQNDVQMIKMESCTKVGNIPSFELFDSDGKIDAQAFNNAPKQSQLFENLGRQLNTDPHESLTSTLLTQFMKIALMNIDKNNKYTVGNSKMSGITLLQMYQKVLDTLTVRGFNTFCKKFGVNPETFEINKEKFMQQLQDMAQAQGASPELIDALTVDNNDYAIHPSALPNINWVQSKLISAMDKTVIKTTIPGKPLFQVASLGFDNITEYKTYKDHTLRSYNEDGKMEVKLSISLFNDVLKQAGLQNDSFNKQRKFILDNQDILLALAYRVPTQGQNSTLPIKIVDLFEPQRGDIIMFPADITTLTGSDFDIDKMFLARYNIEVVNGKARRVSYNIRNINDNTDEQLQNLLLDMYFSVLSSMKHRIDTTTPLDVTTAPLLRVKNEIDVAKNIASDPRDKKSGWWLNPVFQAEQRSKNAGSSLGIGPMALNNVFRFFLQMSGLDMFKNTYFRELGLSLKDGDNYRIYDRDGESVLDATSALINAFVDAVKDNYIGRMNINVYTFDVTSMLISNGFGESTYYFLGQQGIVDLADAYINVKQGNIVADESDKQGNKFLEKVLNEYRQHITDDALLASSYEHASVEELSKDFMKDNLKNKNTEEWYALQCRYIQSFLEMKQVGEEYRKALSVAQIDTGKYGISASDVINFMQTYNVFNSEYNIAFKNPRDLFDKSFLGAKYDYGVKALFDMFQGAILEFSSGYAKTLDNIAMAYGIYGPYGKLQLKRINQRLRTALLSNFFTVYIANDTKNFTNPLYDILCGENTVVDRYAAMKEQASYSDEGKALFDVLRPTLKKTGSPKFFNVDSSVVDNPAIKSNVTQAWQELYDSSNPELSKFAKDLAVYMFFISGGSDNNAGGLTKTTIFDLVPPALLANLSVNNMTYNKYVSNILDGLQKGSSITNNTIDTALQLNAVFDDNFATRLNHRDFMIRPMFKNQAVMIGKGSDKLLNYNTGTYKEFVKIYDSNGIAQLYKLGNVMFQTYQGKKYLNPVYFKVNTLGYRYSRNNAYSVRTDGYVDSNGVVKSLIWPNTEVVSNASQLQNLDKTLQKIADGMIPFGMSVNFADIWDKFGENLPTYDGFGIPYSSYAAIDDADIVLYISEEGNNTRNLVDYSRFKNKDFRVIDGNSKLGYNGNNVFIIGDASLDTVKKITSKLTGATILISTENNPIGNQLIRANNFEPFANKEYNRQPQSNATLGGNTISKVVNYSKMWSREDVVKDKDSLFIFTDNTDRDSGDNLISPNSEYAKKYGKGKHYPNSTQAVARGLNNAMPVSTQRWFHEGAKGKYGRWTDDAFNEFKATVDQEFEDIKRKWDTGKYKQIVFGSGDGLFNGSISEITKQRVPRIYDYLQQKYNDLINYVTDNQSVIGNLTANGNKRQEECK